MSLETFTQAFPYWTSRVPVQFISIDNPSLNVTSASPLFNNPDTYYIQAGQVAKIEMGLNGATYFRGDIEYAPFAIEIDWSQIGINDYQRLCALRPYFITFIDYRGNAFYGKLIMAGPQGIKGKAADAVAVKGMFYVLRVDDIATGTSSLNKLASPSFASSSLGGANTGYIPSQSTNYNIYYWLTFQTIWGETTPGSLLTVTIPSGAGDNLTNLQLVFNWPATTYCTQASIYTSLQNSPNPASGTGVYLMAQIINGEYSTAGPPAQSTWYDYVGPNGCVLLQSPPTVSTAYTGYWGGGFWSQTSPS